MTAHQPKQANKSTLKTLHTHTCWCLHELEQRLSRHVKEALGADCLRLLNLTPDVQLDADGLLVATGLQLDECNSLAAISGKDSRKKQSRFSVWPRDI